MSEVVETLQARLEEASLSLAGMEEERARLERQVGAREEEIARLGRQIGSESNLEKVICFPIFIVFWGLRCCGVSVAAVFEQLAALVPR